MKRITKIIFYVTILISSQIVLCQSLKLPSNIQSPNASSLGKYGELPVNYYTGRVDVSVPIFTTTENDIPLDINLKYDTGGVRVNDLPNWIGQNWSMNAGGIITRTERGNTTDELIYNASLYPYANKGYLYNTAILNNSTWSASQSIKDLVDEQATILDDLEPDLFTFNFLGITGTFFLSHDGQWKVQSDSNIKITINLADNLPILARNTLYPWTADAINTPKCIGKITLTDENGTRYIFGGTQNAIEYSQHDFFDYERGVIANSWYLSSVIDRLGNTVYSFEYDRGDFQAQFYLNYYNKVWEKSNNGGFWQPGGGCMNSFATNFGVKGTLNIPSYLKRITTKNGYVIEFARSISNHKRYSLTDDLMLQEAFDLWQADHGYFTNAGYYSTQVPLRFYLFHHDANENTIYSPGGFESFAQFYINRLKNVKLDKITIKLNGNNYKTVDLKRNLPSERLNLLGVSMYNNGITPMEYKFEYNNFNLLPTYLSTAVDHWGFYKGTNFVSPYTVGVLTSHYASREPNPAYLTIGALTKITYPTQGFTQFEYEPHSYSSYVNADLGLTVENNVAGGLRIKKIRKNDGFQESIKELKYVSEPTLTASSGILSFKNVYYVPNWFIKTVSNSLYRESSFSINSIIPMSNFSGSHIGYSKVFEYNNSNEGYVLHEFTNYNDYPDVPYTNTISISHSQFDTHNRNDFKRGRQKRLSFYNNSGDLLKTIQNSYQSVSSNKVRGLDYKVISPCALVNDPVLIANAYEIEYSDFKQTSSVETQYLDGNTLTKVESFLYADYPNNSTNFGNSFLKSQSFSANLYTKNIEYKYPFDFTTTIETQMYNNHFLPVIETITKKDSEVLSKEKDTYGLFTLYNNNTAYSYNKLMLQNSQKAKGEGSYDINVIFDKYDLNGNVLQYHKNNGLNQAFIWSNNLLSYQIEGATHSEFYAVGLTSLLNNVNKRVTQYTYTPLREVSIIKAPNGVVEKYFYDDFHRLLNITDGNNKLIKKMEYNIKQ